MRRVLLIANTLPPKDVSGVGEQVLQLAAGLRELGDEVEVLGRGPRGAAGPKVLFPLTIVPAAWRALRRFRPDVVQVHESDGALAALLVRAARNLLAPRPLLAALLQVSYVEELRAVRPLVAGGKVLGRPGGAEMRFRWLKAPFQILLGLITVRAADLVLAPSEATAAELRRDYSAGRTGEVGVIPNVTGGLEIAPAGEVEGPPGYLLFVGRLRIRKGVEILLEALRKVPGAVLRIAGDGEHRAALERAAAALGPAVAFLGTRDAAQVRTLLRGAAALVVPSIYEGMPLVVLEAMEAGVPVVASAVSGIPEVVVDGETGWLVPPEDPEALAHALEAVLTDPDEARRRGEAGRRRVAERYRPAVAAASWRAAIERSSEGAGPEGVE
jgi:glycosyltransferase involved in cell wall biosynthesis